MEDFKEALALDRGDPLGIREELEAIRVLQDFNSQKAKLISEYEKSDEGRV